MEQERLRNLLTQLSRGEVEVDQVVDTLKRMPYEPVLGYANLDHHRSLRGGFPEVIYGEGKTAAQVLELFSRLAEMNPQVLATRIPAEMYDEIRSRLPEEARYHPLAKAVWLDREPDRAKMAGISVITAGTADIPVAEEAAITAELHGNQVERIYDVGVAGLHRLLDRLPGIMQARVLVVVAGMDGALPSVVGGLVAAPVIAVPTSVGYGASFQGLAALLAMLNSCASGVAVVNIDNGYGAGCLAARINRTAPIRNGT